MEDDQVIRSMDQNPTEKKSGKNLLIAGLLLLFLVVLSGTAYFLGKNMGSKVNSNPTPTPILFPTVIPTESPTPTMQTASNSGTLTPTKVAGTKTPTPTPTPNEKTKILISKAGLDGFRSSNNGGNNSLDIRAGRNSNLVTRGFVTFAIDGIPSNAQVKSATLRLYQAKVIGDPYTSGGALKIDHLTYGDSLDSTDYGLPALTSNIQTLTTNKVIEWKDADVTDEFKNDLSNTRSTSQFRIHFTTEGLGGDITGDFAYFDSANSYSDNSGHSPQLVIKYY